MIADSLGSRGASRVAMISRTWFAVMIPPIIVCPPVIVRGNQSSSAIVQLQCRISQCIGNAILGKLRTNGANNYSLWFGPLNNEAANHHVVACLNQGAGRDVSES